MGQPKQQPQISADGRFYWDGHPPESPLPTEKTEYSVTLGEATARLCVSRAELETMIAAGKIEALPTGFTRMIPTREIQRLSRPTHHE